jgi:hypothetical protein
MKRAGRADQRGYADITLPESPAISLAELKLAVAKTGFILDNVEWGPEPGSPTFAAR